MPPKYLVVVYETTKRLVAADSRPLALASYPCKITEKMIVERLSYDVESLKLVSI